MTKNVGMAKAGTGGLVSLLKNSNPTLLKQIQATKGSAEAFDLLMQAAHDTADPMKRNTLLAAAFGDSGVTLARIAELGAKQFREEAKQADVLQGVLGDQAGPEAEAFGDSLTNVQTALTSWRDAIGQQVVPAITPLLQSLSDWTVANRELVATNVGGFVRDFAGLLKAVDWQKFGADLKDLGPTFAPR